MSPAFLASPDVVERLAAAIGTGALAVAMLFVAYVWIKAGDRL